MCLVLIKTMEGCFNFLDKILMLDGFKNYKVMLFKTKSDHNKFPQKLLFDWHKDAKIDKTLISFLKICD